MDSFPYRINHYLLLSKNMKTLIVGDLHLKEKLGYADYISDGRVAEKKKVLDFIFNLSKDCDRVVFMGDQLNGRNNNSEVIREFVQFIERFKQDIFIIAGNHEKVGDGKSAIDFLKEIKNKKWHIITDEVYTLGVDVFCPYFYKGELECSDFKTATEKLLTMLPKGKNLFMHHAVSGFNFKNVNTDDLNEIVLPKKEITKLYERVFCGHIHIKSDLKPNDRSTKVIYAGSIFTNEVNEGEKSVFILKDEEVTEYRLPVREIVKLDNPTLAEIIEHNKYSILKVVLSNKITDEELSAYKEALTAFDGSVLVEDFKTERKIIKFVDGELDLNVINLMKVYAKEKKINFEKLKAGYELIK